MSLCSGPVSIGPSATVGRSRLGIVNDGIDLSASAKTACRFTVCDGVSPKRRRYSTENRPQCGNPQRWATSITLASGMPCSSSRRAVSNRMSRSAARGVLPRNSRNCRCSVRLDRPAASASSITLQSRPTFARIASSARRTPRGSKGVLEAPLGRAFMEDISSDMTMNTRFGEKFHDRDSSVANWIEDSRPLS